MPPDATRIFYAHVTAQASGSQSDFFSHRGSVWSAVLTSQ
jgi:hypothetical protein